MLRCWKISLDGSPQNLYSNLMDKQLINQIIADVAASDFTENEKMLLTVFTEQLEIYLESEEK